MDSFNQIEGVVAPTDVFVATPMDEEWRMLLSVFGGGRELPMRGGRTFYAWAYPSPVAPKYLLAGAAMGAIGQTEMSAFATDFLSRWSPRNVAVVGIAGSFEDAADRQRGDVVIADHIYGYELASQQDDGPHFRPTGDRADFVLLDRARALRNSRDAYANWQDVCFNSAEGKELRNANLLPRPPSLTFGPVASGNDVVKTRAYAEKIRHDINEQICAVEMEGKGVFTAVWQKNGGASVLMIRGISDYADDQKEKSDRTIGGKYRDYAGANAARLVKHLLDREAIEPSWAGYLLDSTMDVALDEFDEMGIRIRSMPSQHLHFKRLLHRTMATPALRLTVTFESAPLAHAVCRVSSSGTPSRIEREGTNASVSFALPSRSGPQDVELFLAFRGQVEGVHFQVEDPFGVTAQSDWKPRRAS